MTDYPLLDRGVYRAPCLGPNRETILYAVQSNHCLIAREQGGIIYLPPGDNPFTANAQLWELLDQIDPTPTISSEDEQSRRAG